MKRFLINLFLFLLVTISISWVIDNRMASVELSHYGWHYDELTNSTYNSEGIIIGNSMAIHGIRPSTLEQLGTSFFNFALNGTDATFFLNWYEQLFSKHHVKPKYCIYSLTFNGWKSYEHDSEFFPFKTFAQNCSSSNDFDKKALISNRYPIYKFRTKKIIDAKYREKDYFNYQDYDKGFVATNGNWKGLLPIAIEGGSKDKNESFEILIDKMLADNIQVILVFIPVLNPRLNLNPPPNPRKAKAVEYYHQFARKKGIPILDYNNELASPISHNSDFFVDKNHLNALGSRHFSELLKKDLAPLLR